MKYTKEYFMNLREKHGRICSYNYYGNLELNEIIFEDGTEIKILSCNIKDLKRFQGLAINDKWDCNSYL